MQERKIFDFMRWRMVAMIVSAIMLLVSIGSLAVNQLNFGLDFTGGTSLEVRYENPPTIDDVRQVVSAEGHEKAQVVNFGSDRDIKISIPGDVDDEAGAKLIAALDTADSGDVELMTLNFVGPSVGEELRDEGGIAMIIALAVVMMYVAVRFQFKFSVGAVAALVHDVIIVLGVFSLFGFDFDLTVLAAVLAVIGYSLNDTIVVSDRIRENFRKLREGSSLDVINVSLTDTFSRTIVTSLTTILVLFALFFLGGESIHHFALALLVGVGVGTYSSIYVAANILVLMNVSREDLIVIPKDEDPELMARP